MVLGILILLFCLWIISWIIQIALGLTFAILSFALKIVFPVLIIAFLFLAAIIIL